MAKYSASSPWHNTKTRNNQYLDFLSIRPVPNKVTILHILLKFNIHTDQIYLHMIYMAIKIYGGYLLKETWIQ